MAPHRSFNRANKRVRFADLGFDDEAKSYDTSELMIQIEDMMRRTEEVEHEDERVSEEGTSGPGGYRSLLQQVITSVEDGGAKQGEAQEVREKISCVEATTTSCARLWAREEQSVFARSKRTLKTTTTTAARMRAAFPCRRPSRIAKSLPEVQGKRKKEPMSAARRKKALEELAMSMSNSEYVSFRRFETLSVDFQGLFIGMEGSGSMDKMFD